MGYRFEDHEEEMQFGFHLAFPAYMCQYLHLLPLHILQRTQLFGELVQVENHLGLGQVLLNRLVDIIQRFGIEAETTL